MGSNSSRVTDASSNAELGQKLRESMRASKREARTLSYSGGSELYKQTAEHYATKGGVNGGGNGCCSGAFVGGDEMNLAVVREYSDTLNSFTKQGLVADILAAMKDLGFAASGDNVDAQLKSVLAQLPNSKRGKSFKNDAEAQARICKLVAEAINKNVGKVLVDPSAAPAVVCQSVAELVSSLQSGMHVEFLTIHSEVKTVLRNLLLLREQIDGVFSKVMDRVDASNDPLLRTNMEKYRSLHKMLTAEMDRQITMMKNLIDITLSPAEGKLSALMRSDDDMRGVIENIESAKPGESQFGDVIARVLSGVGLTADYARIVDDALKTVGMSIDEYANATSTKDLLKKVSDGLMSRDMNDDDLQKFMRSYELLNKNYYRAKDIQKVLNKSGSSEMYSQSNSDDDVLNVYNTVEGGIDQKAEYDEEDFASSSLDKRLKTKKEVRTLIFKTFSRTLDEHLNKINKSLDTLANKLGSSISLSDELDGFRNALTQLKPLLSNQNAYLSLIGYYNDALTRQRRDTFVGQLSMIKSYCDTLASMPQYSASAQYFRDVSSAVNSMRSTIDQYSDRIATKFGSGEGCLTESGVTRKCTHCERCSEGSGCDDCSDCEEKNIADREEKTESADVEGGASNEFPSDSVLRRVPINLSEVIRKFDYYYKVIQVKNNLAQTAKEIDKYNENYETLRAEAIAKKIDDVKRKSSNLLAALSGDAAVIAKVGVSADVVTAAAYVKDKQELRTRTAKMVGEHCRVVVDFWRTVEAIDEYMRVFTSDLVKGYDKRQEIKAMLEDVEVINDWYRPETGTLLHELFDSFPSATDADSVNGKKVSDNYKPDSGAHYYDKLSALTIADLPSNCHLVIDADDNDYGFSGFSKMRAVTRNLNLLKNILSVFIRVGDSFGDRSLYKKIFMTPTQIYKNLSDWINVGTFRIGTKDDDQVSGDAAHKAFAKVFGVSMRGVKDELRGDLAECDEMFSCIVKSLCSKVLIVVGLSDVLERPDEVLTFSPIRTMIGGAETPSVESSAAELYLRLPLLAEFYRELFDFSSLNDPAGTEWKASAIRPTRLERISMLPEMEGPFNGLVKLMFKKAKHYKVSEYSDVELKELVAEVNLVWQRMSSAGGNDPVMYIIREFVKEINNRYGIVSQKERNLYESEHGNKYMYAENAIDESSSRDLDIPLLPGEEDIDFERMAIAPSRKFEDGSLMESSARKKYSPNFVMAEHRELLNRFRCQLDSYFKTKPAVATGTLDADGLYVAPAAMEVEKKSFRPVVKAAKMRLRDEKNAEQRFRIIASMVRGSAILSRADHAKYLLFHETVVVPLNVLSTVHTLLASFRNLVLGTDLAEWKRLNNSYGATVAALVDAYEPNSVMGVNPSGLLEFMINRRDALEKIPVGGVGLDALKLKNVAIDLLEAVFALGNDLQGMVTLRVEDNRMTLNFSKLVESVEKTLSSVRAQVDLLRPQMDRELLEKYVNKMNVGSLYWLQEQLYDKIIVGREALATRDAPSVTKPAYVNLDNLNRILNKSFEILRDDKTIKWGDILARELFYDQHLSMNSGLEGISHDQNTETPFNEGAVALTGDTPALGVDYSHPMNKLLMKDEGNKQIVYPAHSNRFHQLYSWGERWSNNGSLMCSFNQILAKYLQLCYDASSEKLYVNTISNFVNGAVNNNIMDLDNTFPDTARGETRIKLVSAKGGDIDAVGVAANARIQEGPDNVDDAINRGLGAVDPTLNLGNLNTKNVAIPAFLSALIAQKGNLSGTQVKSAAKALHDQYMKNSGAYISATNQALTKDIPTPVGTAGKPHATSKFGKRADPEDSNLLYTTLALILRNLLTSKNSANQTSIFLLDNIAEVSMYKKEAMRAHIPHLRGMLKELVSKADFLKRVMDCKGVSGDRDLVVGKTDVGLSKRHGVNGVTVTSEETKAHLAAIANNLSNMSASLITCMDNVLRELADESTYLETHSGSITEYKSVYGVEPFMPLSTALYVLNNNNSLDQVNESLPLSNVGSAAFRLAYGTRQLLNAHNVKVGANLLHGHLKVLEMYNSMANDREQFAPARSMEQAVNVVELLRFVHEVRNYKGHLTPLVSSDFSADVNTVSQSYTENHSGSIARSSFVVNSAKGNRLMRSIVNNIADKSIAVPAYSLVKRQLGLLLDLTENSNRDDQVEKVARHIGGKDEDRTNPAVLNILDLNIIPINVHALMRDIPLVNLYNHSYTFDRMCVETLYGISNDFGNVLIANLCADGKIAPLKSPKDLFLAMLVNPYRKLDDAERRSLRDIMRGDANLPLGRPKFLSDQVLNKLLFDEIYQPNTYNKQHGPIRNINTKSNSPVDPSKRGLRRPNTSPSARANEQHRDEDEALTTVKLKPDVPAMLRKAGEVREDTVLVRNLILLTNVYRTLRLKLRDDLMYNRNLITKGTPVAREENTEFDLNQFLAPRNMNASFGF